MASVLVRALTYSTLFISFVLIFVPAQVVSASNIPRPGSIGVPQLTGIVLALAGGALALWCIWTFAFVGRGTPAPFDPPRRLVMQGPYRVVRNPMYLGAAIAVFGAAVFYQSLALLAYVAAFLLLMHLFVISYEEPTLERTFGQDYIVYCRGVRRWSPRRAART
jgi:protein-S-isoprenylcysteine O-methyltransferase Ste14